MRADARPASQRRNDTEHRLAHDVDVWVASSSPGGLPHLVPLTFDWDGEAVLVATPAHSPTGRNLAVNPTVRLGLGPTRDVTMIDGIVEVIPDDALASDRREHYVSRTGWDPGGESPPYCWFRITPRRIQAWRDVNELPGRDLMRDGRWLA